MVVFNLKQYMALQYKEMTEHAYYLSEKKGYDVGMDYSTMDWVESKQAIRFRDTYDKHADIINKICNKRCNNECKGIGKCTLSMGLVHKVLED